MDKQGKVGWISHEDFLKMKELGIDTPDEYFVYKNNNMDEEDKVNNAPGNTNQGTSENMVLVSRVADVPPS